MKEKIVELGKRHFYFDLTFLVRSLTGVVKGRALFDTIHGTPADEIKNGWTQFLEFIETR